MQKKMRRRLGQVFSYFRLDELQMTAGNDDIIRHVPWSWISVGV